MFQALHTRLPREGSVALSLRLRFALEVGTYHSDTQEVNHEAWQMGSIELDPGCSCRSSYSCCCRH